MMYLLPGAGSITTNRRSLPAWGIYISERRRTNKVIVAASSLSDTIVATNNDRRTVATYTESAVGVIGRTYVGISCGVVRERSATFRTNDVLPFARYLRMIRFCRNLWESLRVSDFFTLDETYVATRLLTDRV
jgi:hypothetical protein